MNAGQSNDARVLLGADADPAADAAADTATADTAAADAAAGAAADTHAAEQGDRLVSRLALIEDQPLEARAAAYGQLHDQLRVRLEDGDQPKPADG